MGIRNADSGFKRAALGEQIAPPCAVGSIPTGVGKDVGTSPERDEEHEYQRGGDRLRHDEHEVH